LQKVFHKTSPLQGLAAQSQGKQENNWKKKREKVLLPRKTTSSRFRRRTTCYNSRMLGLTYKSAWFMAHRIRFAMGDDKSKKLSGVIEVDETFVGGKVLCLISSQPPNLLFHSPLGNCFAA
jgi:hypothetical protein